MNDPNARYRDGFRALTEKLGRVPTSADKEWVQLHDDYKKGWQGQCVSTTGATVAGNGNSANATTNGVDTSATTAGTTLNATNAGNGGPTTTNVQPTAPQARATPETPAGGSPVLDAREDRFDPSPDHDADGQPWGNEALTNPGRGETGEDEESTGEAGSGAGRGGERATVGGPLDIYGARGPNGGVIAECVACHQLWERPRRRGRPSYVCGGCRG